MHTVFIALHTITATVALVAGCLAVAGLGWFGTYLWSLIGMEVFLVAAIAVEWSRIDTATRILFSALAALGLFMVVRAVLARRLRAVEGPYFDHIGFTLVALVDAFLVVFVLNLGAPGWLVVTTGVVVAVIGHFTLRAVRPHATGRPPRAESGPSRAA